MLKTEKSRFFSAKLDDSSNSMNAPSVKRNKIFFCSKIKLKFKKKIVQLDTLLGLEEMNKVNKST